MDDLLREFLTETGEHLDTVDVELVRFEQDPSDAAILRNIFRLVHTVKGTCGFLGLPRLEALAHAAETLMGRLRDGMPVTREAVTLILVTVDRIKLILAELDRVAAEPAGSDRDIIAELERAALSAAPDACPPVSGSHRAGEVSLAELESAFQAAPGPDDGPALARPRPPAQPSPPESARLEPAEPHEPGAPRSKTIRVAVDTLEHLMTMVSELVLTRNQLMDIARRTEGEGGFKVPLQRLSHVTAELQDGIMKTRMQPIGSAWAKLPRVVRDLSAELGKRLELVMHGADTELDRQVLELIRDPLTHMVRNSADHGIEGSDERIRAGKPAHGTIRLNAFHQGGTITIEIADDGRGIDHAGIRRRASELRLAPEAELARMGDEQLDGFIFDPGFSTLRTVGAVSGRGVGMDVVRTNIGLIGGTVEIASESGRGTLFTIKIPLTLAIVAALIVEVGGQRFAIPQAAVMELIRVKPGSDQALERINGVAVIRLRDELLPVIDLAELLCLDRVTSGSDEGFVVVARVGRHRFGMLVDSVLETEEIVVKPMSSPLKHLAVFSGNTILGDGAVVLIVDPNGVARSVGSELLRSVADMTVPERAPAEEAETMTLLVFRGGAGTLKAVPLSLVTRLEEVDATRIEQVGGRSCVQYRGRLMPLVDVDGGGSIKAEGQQPLIVISQGERHIALAVGEIVDVVEAAIEIEPVPGRSDLVGSAIVRGRATEIVDIAEFLPRAGESAQEIRGRESSGPDVSSRSTDARRVPTLLLVDDSPFFRDLLAPVLKAAGYRVRVAANASEAFQVLADREISAIVTDLDLPGRNGLDLVEAALGRPGAHAPVAILLASAPTTDVLRRARELGVFDVVSKFDRSGLLAALSEAEAEAELAA